MPHLDPSWPWAAATALAILLLSPVAARCGAGFLAAALREAALVVGLYAAWQLIGSRTHLEVAGARAHALMVLHAEQALRLPSELALQRLVTPHPLLVQIANGYYLYGHFNPLIALLGWTWWRHRRDYPRVRLLLGLLTGAAFVMHVVPVAPPRLLPQLGFRDVALEYGQSVYGTVDQGISGQLLAMPSLHVGWAVLVAYVAVTVSGSRWRWLVVAHPVLMTLVVTVTANHWWADGAVCAVLLALCVHGERGLRALTRPHGTRASTAPAHEPARTLTS